MKKFLLLCMGAAMSLTAAAQIDFTQEQYIIDSATGQQLTGGGNWDTRLCTKETGRAFMIEPKSSTQFYLKSSIGYVKNAGDLYVDGPADKNATDVAIFTFVPDGDKFIGMIDGKYITIAEVFEYQNPDSWHYQWFKGERNVGLTGLTDDVTKAVKWEIRSKTQMIAALDNATETNPVDATFYVKAHNVEVNDPENDTAWEYTKNGVKSNFIYPEKNWQWDNINWDDQWAWKSTCKWFINDEDAVAGTDVVSQEVTGVKPGYYEARYRIINQKNTPLVIRLNDTEAKAYEETEEHLWYYGMFEQLHKNELTARFKVADDGKLSIRMEKTIDPAQQNRFAFKSIRLNYLGASASVDEIAADNDNAPVEYYNLQGVRVENPAHGLYIKRQGTKATKVIL